jgi:arylsulfatase A-like enzyme
MATQDAPFFLSLHYTAPHWPWETRDDATLAPVVKDNLFHLHGGNIDTYRRMIHHMDEGIGQVMAALERHGVADDTLVIFTSDNGGERFSDNWPLVGGKMDLTEGGIRVPWIAHWPAVIAPGGTSAQQCMTMDWSATILDAAGVAAHPAYPLDGISLLGVLRDAGHSFERPLHWRMNHRGQRALRIGDWKYLRVDGHDYLFDIPADARERANQAGRQPERLAAMRDAWEEWNLTMPAIPEDATVSLGYGVKDMPQR